jgi:chemotaxis protein methyltransferase WspC
MTNDRKEIEEWLTRRIGLDPVSMGPHLIDRAARRRMAELGLPSLGDYAAHLLGSEAEQQALIEEVVVPESWFFRDERPFRWLAEHVRGGWIAAPRRSPFRALSVPCAGGQEPYSIAIALLDAGLPRGRLHIDAVDVSARLLEVARRGLYSANAFRGAESGRGMGHFLRRPEGYEIDPAIRSAVHFARGNILDPALLADAPAYDVVFCRNLLIYLGAAARAGVLATLDRLLAEDGVLFIGHADRLDASGAPARFAPVGEPGCFAYRRVARAPASPPVWPGPATIPAMAMLPEPEPLLMLPPARPQSEPPPIPAAGPASPPPTLLEQAAELANRGRYDEAVAACERHLRNKGPGPAAYYLMGMIRQAAGDRRKAEECFHKTIYLDPGHDEALLALALLAERRGDLAAATGFRRRAHRAGRPPSVRPL